MGLLLINGMAFLIMQTLDFSLNGRFQYSSVTDTS